MGHPVIIKTMKDLQDILESTPLDKVQELSAMMEDDVIEKNAPAVWQVIIAVYFEETGIKLDNEKMKDEEVNGLFFRMQTSVAIHIGVRLGHMKMTNGRLKISNDGDATFSMTDRGKNYVENKILPKLK